jgi:hypothetical protein
MKKHLILLLLSAIFLTGCNKDDSNKKSETDLNTFSINGVQYDIELEIGFGFYFESIGINGLDMYGFQAGGNASDDLNISFSICWQNTVDNVAGNFMKALEFEETGWRFECSNIDISATEFEEFATGQLTVTQISESTYRVEFNGATDSGSEVTIRFERPIVIID